MVDRPKPFYLLGILIALFPIGLRAQVNVDYKNAINRIKDGHTYIVGFTPILSNKEAFLDIFQKYWTITKDVSFISPNDLPDRLDPADSYFVVTREIDGEARGTEAVDASIALWMPKNRVLRKRKSFSNATDNFIGSIVLTQNVHYSGRRIADTVGANSIGYWSRGNLKNFLQEFSAAILSGKKADVSDDITDKDQLKLLQSQTLYCSPDVFFQSTSNRDKAKFIKEVFRDYPYPYSVISIDQLSAKILADKEPFYYLIYLHNHVAGNVVAIMNSRTGQLIYSRTKSSFTDEIKPEYLKDIFKGVN